MAIAVRPIADTDLPRVGAFLRDNLNGKVPAAGWAAAAALAWAEDPPNAGFMLLDGETVVGAHLAFYSDRIIDGRRERFCNLGAWCVLEEHRFHGLRLLKALLAQDGYHFTDLSPSGNVIPINVRLGFSFLDTATALVPNLPWPSRPRRGAISTDPVVLQRTLTGRDLDLYRDHAATAAARHLVLLDSDEWCYVVFRKDRRKGLPIFATILHVSHPEVFRRMARRLARHLLLRHGALATLAEDRVVTHRPHPSFELRSPRRKMFRSPRLGPAQIDYFYSELFCVPW
jgi:hypothetical protein